MDMAADNDDEPNNKPSLSKNEFDVLKQALINKFKDVYCAIDPTLMSMDKQRPLIMYCNDFRKNIFFHEMTYEDKKHVNVGFVNFHIHTQFIQSLFH